jgi:hypothetical protein
MLGVAHRDVAGEAIFITELGKYPARHRKALFSVQALVCHTFKFGRLGEIKTDLVRLID